MTFLPGLQLSFRREGLPHLAASFFVPRNFVLVLHPLHRVLLVVCLHETTSPVPPVAPRAPPKIRPSTASTTPAWFAAGRLTQGVKDTDSFD